MREVRVEVIPQTVVGVELVAKEVVVLVAKHVAKVITIVSIVDDVILVSLDHVSMTMMTVMMTVAIVMKPVARQQRQFALTTAEAPGTTASVVTDAPTTVETRQSPTRRRDRRPELTSRTEEAGMTGA